MNIDQWNEVHLLRASLWGEHRAPVPSASVLRLSLPVVADLEFDAVCRWLGEAAVDGDRFVPAAADIAAAFRQVDRPVVPTFDEAFDLVFGHGSRVLQGDFDGVPHIVASWASRAGLDRLRTLPVFDPDYGELRRAELKRSWDAHVEASKERQLAVRALPPGERAAGLARMDPLSALGIAVPQQLERGDGDG